MILEFETVLSAQPETVWSWVSSGVGINKELFPVLRMSSLAAIKTDDIQKIVLGEPLVRSWLLLFGLIPIDYSDLTLIEISPGKGFVEQSPMLSMVLWRHERRIESHANGSIIRDKLTFEPRFFPSICTLFVKLLFSNRHKVLARQFG